MSAVGRRQTFNITRPQNICCSIIIEGLASMELFHFINCQIYNCKIYSKKTQNKSRTSQLFTFAYSWITAVWLQTINFLYKEYDSSYMYCKEFYTFVSGKKTFKKELKLVLWYHGEINVLISLRWNTGFNYSPDQDSNSQQLHR
jgi:hypothetical protein